MLIISYIFYWLILDIILLIFFGIINKLDYIIDNKFIFPIVFFRVWIIGSIFIILKYLNKFI